MKNMLRAALCSTLITLFFNSLFAQTKIAPTFFGQNYWLTDHRPPLTQGPQDLLDWTLVNASGTRLVRIGGHGYNSDPNSWNNPTTVDLMSPVSVAEYVIMIDNIRSKNCEPVLTIPFEFSQSWVTSNFTTYGAELDKAVIKARRIVDLLNNVHQRNVKYFIIGNEPDIDYGYNTASTDVLKIATYVKAISTAIKSIDPNALVIGPEYSWLSTSFYDELFSGTGGSKDISGLIPQGTLGAGKPYVDFVSVHQYLYNYSSGDPQVKLSLTYTPIPNFEDREMTLLEAHHKAVNDPTLKYRGVLKYLKDLCNGATTPSKGAAVAALRGSAFPLKFMITETQSFHDIDLADNGNTVNSSTRDHRGFYGGQLWARMMGLAMEYGCSSFLPWSSREGVSTPTAPSLGDRGYISSGGGPLPVGTPRVGYYHYKLMSKYFNGSFYKDENTFSPNEPFYPQYPDEVLQNSPQLLAPPYLQTIAFATRGTNIAVMVLNRKTSTQAVDFRFTTSGTFTGTASEQFKFNMGLTSNVEYNTSVPAESTVLFIFDCGGNPLGYWTQTKTGWLSDFSYTGSNEGNQAKTTPNPLNSSPNCLGSTNCNFGWDVFAQPANTVVSGPTKTLYKVPGYYAVSPSAVSNSALTPGAYVTEYSGTNVCASEVVSLLGVIHQKSLIVDAGPDKVFCSPGSVQVGEPYTNVPNVSNNNSYSWSTLAGGSQSGQIIVGANPSSTTIFTVTATNTSFGCPANSAITDQATVIVKTNSSPDIMIRDSYEDVGNPNNPETAAALGNNFWSSCDIWNRQTQDDYPLHQNPTYGQGSNYLYVRATNIGCSSISGNIRLYWSKASTANPIWNSAPGAGWTAQSCTPICTPGPNPYCADFAGQIAINVPANSSTVGNTSWTVPVISPDYTNCPAAIGTDGHFCLTALFDEAGTTSDPLGTYTTGASAIFTNAKGKNNVAWKNMQIVAAGSPQAISVGNTWIQNDAFDRNIRLNFKSIFDNLGENILSYATIRFQFTGAFMDSWRAGGSEGAGFTEIDDNTIEITDADAYIENIFMQAGDAQGMAVQIIHLGTQAGSSDEDFFNIDVEQVDSDDGILLGGMTYAFEKGPWEICDGCTKGSVTGINNSQAKSTNFMRIIPNPNNGVAILQYYFADSDAKEIQVTNITGNVVERINIETNVDRLSLDFSAYANGLYLVRIIDNKGNSITQRMVITK
jgi:hypothetical protein